MIASAATNSISRGVSAGAPADTGGNYSWAGDRPGSICGGGARDGGGKQQRHRQPHDASPGCFTGARTKTEDDHRYRFLN